jgi:squalene-hopene/tetraprenyl-beta-curcumene cyclase
MPYTKSVLAGLAIALAVAVNLPGPNLFAADPPAAAANASGAAQTQTIIAKALGYLKAKQNDDGGWQGRGDPPGITAIVLKAFVQDGHHGIAEPFIKKGFDRLLSYQNADGSVSESLVTYNTAITITSLVASKDPAQKDAIAKAIGYLREAQFTDKIQGFDEKNPAYGGWAYGKKGRPDLSNVQTALDALHDAGLKADDPAFVAALKFVNRAQNHSETNDQPWAGDDGGFIYTVTDGGGSSAGEYTDANGKKVHRSYGSMTYAGLKSMMYAGLTKDDSRVKAAWEWIGKNWTLDENPGLKGNNPRSGDSGLFYYYHTLARALRAYGEPIIVDPKGVKHDWRLELIEKLQSQQNADGSWTGTQRWMENRPILSTTFGVLALQEALEDLKAHPVTK